MITSLSVIFALGTMGFWVFFTALSILFWVLLAFEKRGWATFGLIVAVAIIWIFGGVNPVTYAVRNPLNACIFVGAYIAGAVVNAVYKWWDKCTTEGNKYRTLRAEWMERTPGVIVLPLTPAQKEQFHRDVHRAVYISSRPKFKDNKVLITSWMIHWPWHLSLALVHDPIAWLFRQIRDHLKNLFDRISARAYKGIDD